MNGRDEVGDKNLYVVISKDDSLVATDICTTTKATSLASMRFVISIDPRLHGLASVPIWAS